MPSPVQDHEKCIEYIFGTSKQVIVYLIPTVDEFYLLVDLEEEQKVIPKKHSSSLVAKKTVEEVGQGSEKIKPLSKFEDVFDVDYSTPLPRGHMKAKRDSNTQVLGITTAFT